jgi:hypothetical protein
MFRLGYSVLALGARAGATMKLELSLPLAIVGVALAFPSGSIAAPTSPPQMDTATATGDNLVTDDFSSFDIHVNAFSGPSGENPGGSVSFDAGVLRLPISGPVTCLNVSGNKAVMTVGGPFPSLPGFTSFLIQLTDNGGSGLDRFEYFPLSPENSPLPDCFSGSSLDFGGALIGRAVVSDAQPLPTSKRQCKHGGWRDFGFRNQGQCIALIKHRPVSH